MKKNWYGLIILVLIVACTTNNNKPSDEVILNLDESLLAKEAIKLNDTISFQAPKDWKEMDSATLLLLDSTIYAGANIVKGGLQSKDEKSFLLYLTNPQDQLKQDSASVNEKKWLAIQHSEFLYNNLTIAQTVLQNHELVLFKVNIKKTPLLPAGIHFFIDRKMINSHAILVESSIGSISLNK